MGLRKIIYERNIRFFLTGILLFIPIEQVGARSPRPYSGHGESTRYVILKQGYYNLLTEKEV